MFDWRLQGTKVFESHGMLFKLVKFVPRYNARPLFELYAVDPHGLEEFVGYVKEVVWNGAADGPWLKGEVRS